MAGIRRTRRVEAAALAVLCLVWCGVSLAAKGTGKSDKDKLQGDWVVQSAEKGGEKFPDIVIKEIKAKFEGDKFTLEFGDMKQVGIAKFDESKTPKTIDLKLEDKTALGIYQIEGDTIKVCLYAGDTRPTKFESPANTDVLLVVFKRPPSAKDKDKEKKVPGKPSANPGATPPQGDKKDKSDQERFQGAWKLTAAEHDGKKAPQEILDELKIVFKGDKLTMALMDKSKDGEFKLDPTTKPKSIEMTVEDKAIKGIYEFDGETLKICGNEEGNRPTKFDGGTGTKNIYFQMKRVSAEKKDEKKEEKKTSGVKIAPADFAGCCADEGASQGASKSDKDSFQGDWEVTSAEKGGEKIGDNMLTEIKIKFAGDKLMIDLFGTKSEGTFKLDPTKKPKTIDVTLDDKIAAGIYELTGDVLKISLGEPGQARPKDFNGTAGTENSMVILKRGKAGVPGKKEEAKSSPQGQVKIAPAPPGKKTDKDALQGVWKFVALEVSGQKTDPRDLTGMRLIFAGGKVTAVMGVGEPEEGTFTMDASKEPRQLDLTLQGKTMKAIYRLEGDKLTMCAGEPGVSDSRPTRFVTADTKVGLLVLERAKGERVDGFDANAPQSINNLKQIVLAMHNYLSVHNKFPGAAIYSKDGKPLLSWRVAILPYIEYNQLYLQFKLDEPWDSEHNKKLIPMMPRVYTPYHSGEQRKTMTPYRVFTGPMTAFEGPGKDIQIADFTDGTSNTVLVVEAADQVTWTKPEEFAFDRKKPLPKLGGQPFLDRFHIAMADGSVRSVSAEFDAMIFRDLITRNGGEVVDFTKLEKAKKTGK